MKTIAHRDYQSDIDEMMRGFNQKIRHTPTIDISLEEQTLRVALIKEEIGELLQAIENKDLVEIADGIVDAMVVIVGTALTYGIDIKPVWNEIHNSNMTKTKGPKDPETGKQLKPEGWKPPDVKRQLILQGWTDDTTSEE